MPQIVENSFPASKEIKPTTRTESYNGGTKQRTRDLGKTKGVLSGGGVWECNTPPTYLKFVGILTKCIGKISSPNVVGKFGVFYHKKRNAEFYQYQVPQKPNLY